MFLSSGCWGEPMQTLWSRSWMWGMLQSLREEEQVGHLQHLFSYQDVRPCCEPVALWPHVCLGVSCWDTAVRWRRSYVGHCSDSLCVCPGQVALSQTWMGTGSWTCCWRMERALSSRSLCSKSHRLVYVHVSLSAERNIFYSLKMPLSKNFIRNVTTASDSSCMETMSYYAVKSL